jgi:hypothetical protein
MGKSWKEVALEAVLTLGGRSVRLQDIYREVERNSIVTAYHKQPWRPGGQPRFECWTRRVLSDLVREGKLTHVKRIGDGLYSSRR